MKSTILFRASLLVASLASCAAALASPATYTVSATASGTLGGTAFTNALVTLVGSGDTAGVMNPSAGFYTLLVPTTVTIAGLGTATLTGSPYAYSNGVGAGFAVAATPC